MKTIAIISFTGNGAIINRRLREALSGRDRILSSFHKSSRPEEDLTNIEDSLAVWTETHFSQADALIFIGACGIAVRAIAPCLSGKWEDPAVLVIDEKAAYCISLLSGHAGGANRLTEEVSAILGAQAVITTATDRNGLFSVDSFALSNQLCLTDPELAKLISADLLAGECVGFFSDLKLSGETALPKELLFNHSCRRNIVVSLRPSMQPDTLTLIPRIVHIGIGCRKGCPSEEIRKAISAALGRAGVHPRAIADLSSIDRKAEEEGILKTARELELPFRTFTAAELAAVPGSFEESDFVSAVTGVGNVCERAACAASGGGTILLAKTNFDGVTIALACEERILSFGPEVV